MLTGVRPLAEKEPYRVARMLIDATVNMIRLQMHQEDMDQEEDYSEAWCKRLHELDRNYEGDKATLVHTLVFACEQVYERSSDSVVALDEVLRDQQWKVFKRLRQHLYAQYPNEITKPWIRELILEHGEYHLYKHHYEFQRMIRSACEHFGEQLLTEAERTQIFDAIHTGPSKANYQAWVEEGLDEEFTEERFQQHRRNFHRLQFTPFQSVLFGEYEPFFQGLEEQATDPISDEDYPPIQTRSGHVFTRSPRPVETLAVLTDEELLSYINDWERNDFAPEGDSLVEINIEGLAGAFQTVFKETIVPDADRFQFWMQHYTNIARPIYVRMMINVIQENVKEKNLDKLSEWLTFSEWVLSHPDQGTESDYKIDGQGDESRTRPNWYNSRRAIGDFIETCLREETDLSLPDREQLAKLLEMLCTQFDSGLDNDEITFPDQNNLLNEAFNNTRSRALQTLIGFALWLREHDSASKVPEVIAILEKRITSQTEYPLTLPEYAMLGRLYPGIINFNKEWAIQHKLDFFPQDKLPEWLAAFSSFICSNAPHQLTYEIFLDDFDFALQHIADCEKQDHTEEEWINTLGQHLFTYYLWELHPLRGSVGNDSHSSLLERYYQLTNNNRKYWAYLFDYVGGHILLPTSEQLSKNMEDRIIAFFKWRLEQKEPIELEQFKFWLESKCLEAEWRLEAYWEILEVCKLDDAGSTTQMAVLCDLLPNHTGKVFECFAKLTDRRDDHDIYIQTEKAKTLLETGLNSSDKNVYKNAERARDNLLRAGTCDLSDLTD